MAGHDEPIEEHCGGGPEQRANLLLRWKHLTENVLPARARAERWPIRFDHCFKRISLDNAVGDVWYRHLEKPAERHLHGEPLRRAVSVAEDIVNGGLPALQSLDAASLRFRGKRPKGVTSTS